MNIAGALKRIFLFKEVPEPVLNLVATVAEEVSFGAGETIASEGDPVKAMYLIRSGTVRATREGVKSQVVFGTGEAFGQVPLIDGGPAGMTAVALERVDLLAIRARKLAEVLAANHQAGHLLYHAIARSLAARLRRAVDLLALSSEDPTRPA